MQKGPVPAPVVGNSGHFSDSFILSHCTAAFDLHDVTHTRSAMGAMKASCVAEAVQGGREGVPFPGSLLLVFSPLPSLNLACR